ncbi:uncharacterized protein BYT42DRAFT_619986 [Radiomyces spectabilis]|uniref:uncharacterized protein n=1 Tax=Radiomyces spectabilis TaxID=64574 RepID=UPI00221F0D04|nr:uncharacterized protein BYT42DRAFT_619986 [Radiomyces spectabilis]KAI8393815.1 hypothetical protein BYT42DRAFT_619986 [Radiomyces spectabilis]
MSVPQAINDITAAVVQPAGPSPLNPLLSSCSRKTTLLASLRNKKSGKSFPILYCTFVHKPYPAPGALFIRDHYTCHRAGSYHSTAKKRRVKPSIRCGCQARISVSSYEAERGFVEEYLRTGPIFERLSNWIEEQVQSKFTWAKINEMLRLDSDTLTKYDAVDGGWSMLAFMSTWQIEFDNADDGWSITALMSRWQLEGPPALT